MGLLNGGDGNVGQRMYYNVEQVEEYLGNGSWVVDTVDGDELKELDISTLMWMGLVCSNSDCLKYSGKVYYTILWDYSDDYGLECEITVQCVKVNVDEELVEIPLQLLNKELEFLIDHIQDHEENTVGRSRV